jgi:hypothetical protein
MRCQKFEVKLDTNPQDESDLKLPTSPNSRRLFMCVRSSVDESQKLYPAFRLLRPVFNPDLLAFLLFSAPAEPIPCSALANFIENVNVVPSSLRTKFAEGAFTINTQFIGDFAWIYTSFFIDILCKFSTTKQFCTKNQLTKMGRDEKGNGAATMNAPDRFVASSP